MVDGHKIPIDDQRSPLKKAFKGAKLPEIDGNNLFTGEYLGGAGHEGLVTNDNDDWERFWRSSLKQEPPGKLAKGAKAIMVGEHFDGDPIALVPEKVSWDGNNVKTEWQRVHLATPEDSAPKSRFSVLLVPDDHNEELIYRDVFLVEEQRKRAEQLRQAVRPFIEGSEKPVVLMPTLKLQRKAQFTGTRA